MPHTILLVDDLALCREPIAAMLRQLGYRVHCAADGRKAMEMLEDYSPDLVLLDLAMPRMGGLDVLEAIRDLPQYRDLPIIVFSGSGNAAGLVRGLRVQDCLVKGHASLADLRASIERALARSPGDSIPLKLTPPAPIAAAVASETNARVRAKSEASPW